MVRNKILTVTNPKMEKKQEHENKKPNDKEEKEDSAGLPIEDNPYVKYNDLEDYKRQGYGTERAISNRSLAMALLAPPTPLVC
ncbi:Late embryogenesis abundant protein, LEA-18 [Corchorus olitorius]|uniref:Late embryogenesis abundant protein, LEA-18 n=1 Tax=Corchorus olitorius TaxID=93759 RepID=A0A1R3FWS4_9ROSI|nr:Late embryogenesis abundant protein, LEA-18 [Corchorus olitorius]